MVGLRTPLCEELGIDHPVWSVGFGAVAGPDLAAAVSNVGGFGVLGGSGVGAQGVSLGTRFVASDEAAIHPAYKRRVVEATAADTVYNQLYDVWWPDAPHRTLRNKTVTEWEAAGKPPPGQRPGEGVPIGRRRAATGEWVDWPRYATGMAGPEFDGDVEYAPLWAGESCSVVNDVKPAGEIVHDLVRDAAAALAQPPTTEQRGPA
jgi:nitronate monooxygenase